MIEQAPLLDHGALRDARGARRVDHVGQTHGRRPDRRGRLPRPRCGLSEFGEAQDLRAHAGRDVTDRRFKQRGGTWPGQDQPRAAVGNDLGESGGGKRWVQGQKRSPCALHRDHPSQQVDAALGEQDDDYIAADAVIGEPVGDDRAPTRELAVTEPNPPGGHCRGVRRPLCLLGKSIEKSAWSVKSGLGAVPIDEQAPAFFRRQQRQPRDPLLGISDDCFQQCLQMRRHSLNCGSIEEIGAVLEPATQTLIRVEQLEHQVDARDAGVDIHKVRGQALQGRGLRRRTL